MGEAIGTSSMTQTLNITSPSVLMENDHKVGLVGLTQPIFACTTLDLKQESLALAGMARDDPPASSTASGRADCSTADAKWDRNLKPKLAIMRQCTSVTDRWTDGQTHWHHGISARCIYYISR